MNSSQNQSKTTSPIQLSQQIGHSNNIFENNILKVMQSDSAGSIHNFYKFQI